MVKRRGLQLAVPKSAMAACYPPKASYKMHLDSGSVVLELWTALRRARGKRFWPGRDAAASVRSDDAHGAGRCSGLHVGVVGRSIRPVQGGWGDSAWHGIRCSDGG